MPVRLIGREDVMACEKIQSIAFAYSLDLRELEGILSREPEPPAPYIGHFDGEGNLTACMELPEYKIRYEGGWARMTGIAGVASLPECRFGGAVRQLVQFAFQRMRQSGALFSALYPFSHAFYRQFGFELCQFSAEYEIPAEALAPFRCMAGVRMVQPGAPLDALKAVFSARFSEFNLAIEREDRRWRGILGRDPYKERIYAYLLEECGAPIAYVVLSPEDDGPGKIGNVREIAFAQPRALAQAFGFLYRLSAQYGKFRMYMPGVPLASLLGESYALRGNLHSPHGQPMARAIDVRGALERKRHFDGARYSLRVRDEMIPENDGLFSVECEAGRVRVAQAGGIEPDLTADVRTMTQLLLGFSSIDDALYREDVCVSGNLETLRRVFVRRPVYLTEHF